jgi:hypothetical protein
MPVTVRTGFVPRLEVVILPSIVEDDDPFFFPNLSLVIQRVDGRLNRIFRLSSIGSVISGQPAG